VTAEGISDRQAMELRERLLAAARRMTDIQILELADALHEVRRRRRGEVRSFAPMDPADRDLF
jgi:hypothetical protein